MQMPSLTSLQKASVAKIETLLDLFPAASLKKEWDERTKKAAVTRAAGDREYIRIIRFMRQYVNCCKQHVYVFSHQCRDLTKLPENVLGRDGLVDASVSSSGDQASFFYLLELPYNVLTGDPPKLSEVVFFWPVKISFDRKQASMRCVTFERDMKPLVASGTVHWHSKRAYDERDLKVSLVSELAKFGVKPTDIQKGIKALWQQDFIDAFKGQFKKALSTATEAMDEDLLVKRDDPELFKMMMRAPLKRTYFKVLVESVDLKWFIALPDHGHITIPTMTDEPRHSEYLLKQIVANNG